MRNLLIAGASALALSACSTLDGVGARLAASDVTILDAALFVEDVVANEYDFDPSNRIHRIVAYKAVDTVAAYRRGEITEDEAVAEVRGLIEDHLVVDD